LLVLVVAVGGAMRLEVLVVALLVARRLPQMAEASPKAERKVREVMQDRPLLLVQRQPAHSAKVEVVSETLLAVAVAVADITAVEAVVMPMAVEAVHLILVR
jgi:hypothetical protein